MFFGGSEHVSKITSWISVVLSCCRPGESSASRGQVRSPKTPKLSTTKSNNSKSTEKVACWGGGSQGPGSKDLWFVLLNYGPIVYFPKFPKAARSPQSFLRRQPVLEPFTPKEQTCFLPPHFSGRRHNDLNSFEVSGGIGLTV